MKPFDDFDLRGFWEEPDQFTHATTPTPEQIATVESELGYKLPESYLALVAIQNGGSPKNSCFPTTSPTSDPDDYVMISAVLGIGGKWGIDSTTLGNRFMIQSWGYPDIGILVGECPSAGHDAIMLDYSACGPRGEPSVIHVVVEMGEEPWITLLAQTFEAFIRGLVHESVYDTSEADLVEALERIQTGRLSSALAALVPSPGAPAGAERSLRNLCRSISETKGYFALHSDPQSQLVYDFLFLLYTASNGAVEQDSYLEIYPSFLVFGDGELTTGGYAPGFLEQWFEARRTSGLFVPAPHGVVLSEAHRESILSSMKSYDQTTDSAL